MSRVIALAGLHPTSYASSPLHSPDRIWLEKNCYVDIWIEVLHSLKLQPEAMLGFTLGVDFEGDQWTFFKPRHSDLRQLYGVDVQELTLWRSLDDHVREHVGAGKLISTEADAFWLPDTRGTDYRRNHVKTTIVINEVDFANRTVAYFHNAGYFRLEGEDFDRLFAAPASGSEAPLPLYAEFIRKDRSNSLPLKELGKLSRELLHAMLDYMPEKDPVERFKARFQADLPALRNQGLEHYHRWAFATVRQLGAALELTAMHLTWLTGAGALVATEPAALFTSASQVCKALILKAARSVSARRAIDMDSLFAEIGAARNDGIGALRRSLR